LRNIPKINQFCTIKATGDNYGLQQSATIQDVTELTDETAYSGGTIIA
jgi:hypothetical protein